MSLFNNESHMSLILIQTIIYIYIVNYESTLLIKIYLLYNTYSSMSNLEIQVAT